MEQATKATVTPIFLDHIQAFGNKHYKLVHNLLEAKRKGYARIVTFGGAWSNSVHALAHIGMQAGFETVAVIRGERPRRLSTTLQEVEALGMHLHFVSRGDYRRRHEADFLDDLLWQFPNSYLLPEGGTNLLAVEGARRIVADVDVVMGTHGDDYDVIALPVATGGTLAGIATALPAGKRVLGISVLKGSGPVLSSQGLSGQQIDAGFIDASRSIQPAADLEIDVAELIRTWRLQDKIARAENASSRLSSTASSSGSSTALSAAKPNWSIEHGFHCGGYARCPAYLREFILGWEADHAEQLDPVYTAKLFYALEQMQQSGELTAGTRIVALHTGGLQGRRGFDF